MCGKDSTHCGFLFQQEGGILHFPPIGNQNRLYRGKSFLFHFPRGKCVMPKNKTVVGMQENHNNFPVSQNPLVTKITLIVSLALW